MNLSKFPRIVISVKNNSVTIARFVWYTLNKTWDLLSFEWLLKDGSPFFSRVIPSLTPVISRFFILIRDGLVLLVLLLLSRINSLLPYQATKIGSSVIGVVYWYLIFRVMADLAYYYRRNKSAILTVIGRFRHVIGLSAVLSLAAYLYYLNEQRHFVLQLTAIKIGIIIIALSVLWMLLLLVKPDFIRKIERKIAILGKFSFGKVRCFYIFIRNWSADFRQATAQGKILMTVMPIFLIILAIATRVWWQEIQPPRILSASPANDAVEIPLTSIIEIVFDRQIIKPLAAGLIDITPPITGSMIWEGDQKLIFIPEKPLLRETTYTVSFRGPVFSEKLIPSLGRLKVIFSTIGNPQIVVRSPDKEALELYNPVTVIFDRPMIPLTTATNSALKAPAFVINPEVEGEGRWLGTTAYQFRPTKPYRLASTYKVTVPGGIESIDGGVTKTDYSWEFSSARPKIIRVTPELNYSYANPVASVAAFFDQDLDPLSVADRIVVTDEAGKVVSGRSEVRGRTLAFFANPSLTRGKTYQVEIKPGILSQAGPNGLEEAYHWNFAVAPWPSVVSTKPKQGEVNVAQTNYAEVMFRTPMDEKSFKNNVTIYPKPEQPPSINFFSYSKEHRLSIGTYFGRSQSYTITVSGNVKDQYGVPLGSAYSFTFETAPYRPSVSIYPSHTYFGAFNQQVVPRIVASVANSDSVNYELYRLDRDQFLMLYNRRLGNGCNGINNSCCYNWQCVDVNQFELVKKWSETFEASLNTPVNVITKVTNPDGGLIPSGIYFLEVRIPQGVHDNMVMVVTKTTMTVKTSPDQLFVWAVSQTDGAPVSGMEIELVSQSNSEIAKGTTNNDGVFIQDVSLKGRDPLLLFGKKGDDLLVASTVWNTGLDRYDFGLPTYYTGHEGYTRSRLTDNFRQYIVLDRTIFRPGSTVQFKGLVRKDNDGAYENVGTGDDIRVTITDPRMREVMTQQYQVNSYGSYSGKFAIANDASVGKYTIKSEFRGHIYQQIFQVEEYRRPEMMVEVSAVKNAFVAGDKADVNIKSSYYFGAPVTDSNVTWSVLTNDYVFTWDEDRRFEFGNPDDYWGYRWFDGGYNSSASEKVSQGKAVTDAKGEVTITVPTSLTKYKSSQRLVVEAVVDDESNQAIAATNEFIIHRSARYVGVKPTRYSNRSGQETAIEVVTVSENGDEAPESPVTVEFYRRTWQTVREEDPDTGNFYYTSKPDDTLVETKNVVTDNLARALVLFTPTQGGTYKIIARVTDNEGRASESGSFLWVSGAEFIAQRANNDKIILVTDKQDYLVGETMSLFVATPYASDSATTLLTMERGSVIDYKLVKTSDTENNHEVGIIPRFTPNIFVSALLVRPGAEVKKPAEFKIGYTEVKVADPKNRIKVTVSPDKSRYRPGEIMTALVKTTDENDRPKPAEVALGLVDKAVWDLSNTELPEIYSLFYEPRNLEVNTAQLLSISIDRINANLNLGAKGGAGGGCFTGETPILMDGGETMPISEINEGERILTRASDSEATLVPAKVLKKFTHPASELVVINGIFRVTPEHLVYADNVWKPVGTVKLGDTFISPQGVEVPVRSLEYTKGNFVVYNLSVEKYRTYFAGGIYVHNEKGGFDSARKNFPETVYWNAHLTTDEKGQAKISVLLPDNLTTWRLSATANDDQTAFGSAKEEFIVSRDVLIRPFLPRFLSVGDKPELGAIVVNTSGGQKTMSLTIKTDNVNVVEPYTQTVTVGDGQQSKILWETEALEATTAAIAFSAAANGEILDVVETKLPVINYFVPETVATSGRVADQVKEKITLPTEVVQHLGQAKITVSPSLGSGVISSLSFLFDYPYDCTEQITSKFLPAAAADMILRSAKLDSLAGIDRITLKNIIATGIQKLNNLQNADGGWGWWNDNSKPLTSAYAYLGLITARDAGHTVDNSVISRAKKYLDQQLANQSLDLSLQAYIIYAVAEKGDTKYASYAANIYEKRFQLPYSARAQLAIATKRIPGMGQEGSKIMSELTGLVKKTATTTHWEDRTGYGFFNSNTATNAIILEALVNYNPRNPLIGEIVRYLLTSRRDTHWFGTMDTANVIRSVANMLLVVGDEKVDENYRLSLNNQEIGSGMFTKQDLLTIREYIIAMKQIPVGQENSLVIDKTGKGNLYYNVNLNYYLPFTEMAPLEQGLVVVRELVDSDGKNLSNQEIKENSEAWVRLTVVVPEERNYVIIEDRLPAGLEPVNENLGNVSILSAKEPQIKDKKNRQLYFSHREFRDDRVALFTNHMWPGIYEVTYRVRATTPGRYHRPPAQAYQMYVPDVSGHSDAGWFTVKKTND